MSFREIEGNTESIKASRLNYMAEYLDKSWDAGSFLPPEVVRMMTEMTAAISREIAVCLDRRNRVVKIAVGDAASVRLPEITNRRNELRLSGIRILHTHPDGGLGPSEEDLRTLRKLQLDAMIVLGVRTSDGALTGASVSMLAADEKGGMTRTVTEGPVSPSKFAVFDDLFERVAELDRLSVKETKDIRREQERAFLVGVIPERRTYREGYNPLAELAALAQTAGADVVGTMTQRRELPDVRYYIGSGSASELSERARAADADLIIFDDELSASQIRNLENATGLRVIDRTALILDIFAGRARSREGRLQVELAQQKYRLPRLTGRGTEMSRLGGGIGTRGPGETKLESDRRHIRRKIYTLEAQLKEVASRRELLRKERKKRELPVIAVVGYTNAGKSTLVNHLCNANVFAEDELFATLDPSVRKLVTEDNRDFLMVDTVGFIRKLPHDLVEAFKSTLEEAVHADLLLHVTDVSDPDYEDCIRVVERILSEIGAGNRPRYLVLNKTDRLDGSLPALHPELRRGYGRVLPVSSVTGEGMDVLRDEITRYFTRILCRYCFLIPYDKGAVLARLHRKGSVESEEWTESGTVVRGYLPEHVYRELKDLEIQK